MLVMPEKIVVVLFLSSLIVKLVTKVLDWNQEKMDKSPLMQVGFLSMFLGPMGIGLLWIFIC